MKPLLTICAVAGLVLSISGLIQAGTIASDPLYKASTDLSIGPVTTVHPSDPVYELTGFGISAEFQINLLYQAGILDEDIDSFNHYWMDMSSTYNFPDCEEYVLNVSAEGGLTIYEFDGLAETPGGPEIKWTLTAWHQTILAGDIIDNGDGTITLQVLPVGTYRPFVNDPPVNNVEVFDGDLDCEVLGYTFTGAIGGIGDGSVLSVNLPPAPTEVWVDDDFDNSTPGWGTTHFDKIQDGINAVAGSTVNVAAGTYDERLVISKSLTLLGAQAGIDPTAAGARTNPLAESTITEAGLSTPNPDVLIEIPSGVTDVTIDGFTLVGDPTNPIADTSVIRCWDDNIIINNNIINGKYGVLYKGADGLTVDQNRMVVNKNGVVVQPNPASNVTVSGNVFTLGSSPAGDESAIYMTSTTNASITGNTATGFINAKGANGSNNTNLLISENTFTGNKDAVSFWGNMTFVTIRDNILSDSLRYGISIKGQDISILGNDITGNGDTGVNIDRHVIDTERVTLQCNNISGNINYGVKVNTVNVTEIINAEYNWWGDETGPFHPTANPSGLGNEVSDKVDFDPWYNGLMVADITPSITPVDISFTLTAEIAGCCDPVSVQYDIGGIANGYMTDPDDDGIYTAENIIISVPGVHDVYINVEDCYGIETLATAMLVVYDPDGGFVTGGGWIDSPQGAYTPDPSLTGKANFGFVAKYDKKTKLPVGNTEFVFKAGNINFHSSSYQWLVVNKNESRAQFKGSGTINGEGGYKFMLRAGDGEPDTFWIQIWEEDEVNGDELVIYDNGEDQMIGGGSIVVHAK